MKPFLLIVWHSSIKTQAMLVYYMYLAPRLIPRSRLSISNMQAGYLLHYKCSCKFPFRMAFSGRTFKIFILLLDIAVTFHSGVVLVTVLRDTLPVFCVRTQIGNFGH